MEGVDLDKEPSYKEQTWELGGCGSENDKARRGTANGGRMEDGSDKKLR